MMRFYTPLLLAMGAMVIGAPLAWACAEHAEAEATGAKTAQLAEDHGHHHHHPQEATPAPMSEMEAAAADPVIYRNARDLHDWPHYAVTVGDVILRHGWWRGAPVIGGSGAAYVQIENRGEADIALVSARTALAQRVELHNHEMIDGVMRMREVPQITIPAGATVDLSPGGLHLMTMALQAEVKPDDAFPLTLCFDTSDCATLDMVVARLSADADFPQRFFSASEEEE